ncbi:hypothetical protein D3C72_1742470 [compost metagenome]
MTPYIQEFERRFCVDALNSITFGGNIPFHITVMGDLAGDTIIDISLDGEQSVRFIAPTFTDSLFSPMVSTQLAAASKVSNDMIAIASDVLDLGQSGVNFNVAAPMPVTMDPSYSGASGYAENFGLL